jgi:hypothetical protein
MLNKVRTKIGNFEQIPSPTMYKIPVEFTYTNSDR